MSLLPESGLTPGRNTTLRQHESTVERLQKENFGLKMRIFYLEEGLKSAVNDDGMRDDIAQLAELKALLAEKKRHEDELTEEMRRLQEQVAALSQAPPPSSHQAAASFGQGGAPPPSTPAATAYATLHPISSPMPAQNGLASAPRTFEATNSHSVAPSTPSRRVEAPSTFSPSNLSSRSEDAAAAAPSTPSRLAALRGADAAAPASPSARRQIANDLQNGFAPAHSSPAPPASPVAAATPPRPSPFLTSVAAPSPAPTAAQARLPVVELPSASPGQRDPRGLANHTMPLNPLHSTKDAWVPLSVPATPVKVHASLASSFRRASHTEEDLHRPLSSFLDLGEPNGGVAATNHSTLNASTTYHTSAAAAASASVAHATLGANDATANAALSPPPTPSRSLRPPLASASATSNAPPPSTADGAYTAALNGSALPGADASASASVYSRSYHAAPATPPAVPARMPRTPNAAPTAPAYASSAASQTSVPSSFASSFFASPSSLASASANALHTSATNNGYAPPPPAAHAPSPYAAPAPYAAGVSHAYVAPSPVPAPAPAPAYGSPSGHHHHSPYAPHTHTEQLSDPRAAHASHQTHAAIAPSPSGLRPSRPAPPPPTVATAYSEHSAAYAHEAPHGQAYHTRDMRQESEPQHSSVTPPRLPPRTPTQQQQGQRNEEAHDLLLYIEHENQLQKEKLRRMEEDMHALEQLLRAHQAPAPASPATHASAPSVHSAPSMHSAHYTNGTQRADSLPTLPANRRISESSSGSPSPPQQPAHNHRGASDNNVVANGHGHGGKLNEELQRAFSRSERLCAELRERCQQIERMQNNLSHLDETAPTGRILPDHSFTTEETNVSRVREATRTLEEEIVAQIEHTKAKLARSQQVLEAERRKFLSA